MLLSRAPILSRVLYRFAQHGNSLKVAARKTNQFQPIRFSGGWTYRTAAESQPLGTRIWANCCGACK